ncbi:MAG: hypothetical protein ING75_15645 [Rhodocyclaceae bacterium]|nr:hypothetical protein [Rhodocyclaceae bacterium]
MKMHEVAMLQKWIIVFQEAGGRVIREIEKKKEIFSLVNQWNLAFGARRDLGIRQFAKSVSVFLLSPMYGLRIPAHPQQGFTFAFELKPPDVWVPDVSGIPGEFVLFDADFRWSIAVTHEETEILCS